MSEPTDKGDIKTIQTKYRWWGLATYHLREHLTVEEWALLVEFSEKLSDRMRERGASLFDEEDLDEWPDDRREQWEALK